MTSPRPFSHPIPPVPVAVPGPMTMVIDTPSLPGNEPDDSKNDRPTRRWLVPLLLCLLAAALGTMIIGWFVSGEEAVSLEQVDAAIEDAFTSTTAPNPAGPAIYATVLPSLTFIQNGDPGTDGSSIGSGVVINADGLILTSNHVVDGSGQISVTFADGTKSSATIVQADPTIDIAVLQADTLPQVVVPAVLGGGQRIGDPVYALGNPLGLGGSFSAGVISGLDRTLPLPAGRELSQLIQFDAAVNPGSSGGPLVDANAAVVGIVTAIANPTGEDFFSGIGFAVPIATAGAAAGGPQQ